MDSVNYQDEPPAAAGGDRRAGKKRPAAKPAPAPEPDGLFDRLRRAFNRA